MPKKGTKKVYVAMSGGVDSSVAAALLKDEGHSVTGVFMETWSPPGEPCGSRYDRHDAMRVCARLKIPFKSWDFTTQYKAKVVDYMIAEYSAGRTPNPDIVCNSQIKFGLFFEKAIGEGADFIATGHYVRKSKCQSSNDKEEYQLLKGRDGNKDQSYFLWTLKQKHLARTLFPIGEFKSKDEVRSYAKKRQLATSEKKDSQGVCFVGPINVDKFLRKYIEASPGPIVSVTGRCLGEHSGLPFYTLGQRQGIGVGGNGPYYVAEKNTATNTLVVAPPAYEEVLMLQEILVDNVSWVGEAPQSGEKIEASVRYRQEPMKARIENQPARPKPSGEGGELRIKVIFNKPVRAITSGQSAVFYKGEKLLGGGIIV